MADTEKRVTAKFVLDDTGYNDKLKGMNAELKKHQAELKLASQGIKSFGKDSSKLKDVQKSLSQQLEIQSKKVDLYKNAIEKTSNKMKDNIKIRDNLKKSLDEANKKYKETVKVHGKESVEAKKASEQVDKLKKEYEKSSKAVQSNAKDIQNYETNLAKAKTQVVKTKAELQKINIELDRNSNKWLLAGEKLKRTSEKLKNVGSKIEDAGDKILGITKGLVAGGIAAMKFSSDFEDSIAKVSTIADTTQVPVKQLRQDIIKLSDETGIASTEIANATYDAISAGQKTGDAVNFVRSSTKLAKAGFAEASQSLDLLTTIMNSYSMKAKDVTKVSDILINTQNKGKTTVAELSSSMGKVIPTANAFGINLEQVATGYAIMTSKGIKAAETTTYMNSMFNELGKNGTKASKVIKKVSGKSFQELIKNGKSVGDVLALMDKYAKKNKLSLADLFGSAEAGKAALILSTDAGKDFNNMLKSMQNTAGATDEAFKKVNNTTGEKFKKSINKLKNQLIRFGDSASPILDKLSDSLGKLTDKLSNLSDEQINTLINTMKTVAEVGIALKLGGKAIRGVAKGIEVCGGLAEILGGVGAGAEVAGAGAEVAGAGLATAGAGAGAAAGPIGWAALGIAAITLAGIGLYKHLNKEVIPEMDLFADKTENVAKVAGKTAKVQEKNTIKIAKSTKEQLKSYLKLNDEASKKLLEINLNSRKINKKNSKELCTLYDKMTNTIIESIKKKNAKELEETKKQLAKNKTLTQKQKDEIIKKKQEQFNAEITITKSNNKRIHDILDKASRENRKLSEEEKNEILAIQKTMQRQAVENISSSKKEQELILQRLKENSGNITAKQAADVIKNSAKQRDETIKKANEQYEETKAWAEKECDEKGTITQKQKDEIIKAAAEQRDKVTEDAKSIHSYVVDEARRQKIEHLDEIDTESGNVKSKWANLKQWFLDNPVVRFFKSVNEGSVSSQRLAHNWTGTSYWQGGLTYLHDSPHQKSNFELYDLPKGTRIYNHEASEQLVMQTAESIATKIASQMLNNNSNNSNFTVTVPVVLDSKEIARVTTPLISQNLARNAKKIR